MSYLDGFMLVIALIFLFALIASIRIGRKQRMHGNERGNEQIVKHRVISNPIFWAYILFPICIAVGAVLWFRIFE